MKFRKRTKGWGPWKKQWYSICSAHFDYSDICHMCAAGSWVNIWGHKVDRFIYKNWYGLWYWHKNRPGSSARKFIETYFPGLRSKE